MYTVFKFAGMLSEIGNIILSWFKINGMMRKMRGVLAILKRKKKPSKLAVTRELLAIDGEKLAVVVRLNPRARRTVMRMDPVSGKVQAFIGRDRLMPDYKGVNDLFFRSNGDLYIADMQHNRIRRVDAKTKVITTVAGSGVSGVHVATTMRSSCSGEMPALASARRAAAVARSEVASPSAAKRRSRMPVRSRIHSSFVSRNDANSAFGTTRSGSAEPTPATDAKFCSIDNPDCEACQ